MFSSIPTASDVRADADGFRLTVSQPHVAIPGLLNVLQSHRFELARLTTRHVSLEDVFVSLTGRHLDEGEPPREPAGGRRRQTRSSTAS
jgi:ABC-2 type transport system ATP-binding protein